MSQLDPTIQSLIVSVVANGLTSVIGQVGNWGWEIIRHSRTIRSRVIPDQEVAEAVSSAAQELMKPHWAKDRKFTSRLEAFLSSPELLAVVRQLYAREILPDEGAAYTDAIHSEFTASLSVYLGEPPDSIHDMSESLYDALLNGCHIAARRSLESGVLAVHDVRESHRSRLLLDELSAVKRNLDFLTSRFRLDVRTVLDFEERYRAQIADRHQYITPPHFDVARRIPVDHLYVSPNIVPPGTKRESMRESISLSIFLSTLYRGVLLGHPGGGKSTLAAKLCHDLAARYADGLLAGRHVTPVLVVLRDYGALKKEQHCSILQFIELTANSSYQVQPPPGAFEYLLLNGRLMVIFDGLDELLETRHRQEMSADIESFCSLFPSLPVLVTSREVGYSEAPLDEKRFPVYRLAPFTEEQVREYTVKWFDSEPDLTADQRRQKTTSFVQESRIVPDLRSNPLMLALMCNIYRGESYIPRNRPDVYEKCALMLFERWDKGRGITTSLPFEAHISPAMKYIAYWIFSSDGLQSGVTESKLVQKAAQYLHERRFEDEAEARKAAEDFISFCRGRAWVFTDTGTTRDGESLYQFTHRTFLEYFAASYLVRTYPTPNLLGPILRPRIAKKEWDVVSQLAFQIQNKNVEGAGDDLLRDLVEESRQSALAERWNLLYFAARCLQFIVPTPKVVRDIAETTVSLCFDRPLIRKDSRSRVTPVLQSLLRASSENVPKVGECIERILSERMASSDKATALLACEIGTGLQRLAYSSFDELLPPGGIDQFWRPVTDRMVEVFTTRLGNLGPKHVKVALEGYWVERATLAQVAEWHGPEIIFRRDDSWVVPAYPSIAEVAYLEAVQADWSNADDQRKLLDKLGDIGRTLSNFSPPWIKLGRGGGTLWDYGLHRFPRERRDDNRERDWIRDYPDALFGFFAIVAIFTEFIEARLSGRDLDLFVRELEPQDATPWMNEVRDAILAHVKGPSMGLFEFWQDSRFLPKYRVIVEGWIQRELVLVAPSSGIEKKPLRHPMRDRKIADGS